MDEEEKNETERPLREEEEDIEIKSENLQKKRKKNFRN